MAPVSAHKKATFEGVMHTEMYRMLITNTREQDYASQVIFFAKRLRARGHNMRRFAEIVEKYPHSRRRKLLGVKKVKKESDGCVKTFGFTMKYVKGIEEMKIGQLSRCATNLLSRAVGTKAVVRPRFSVGKNAFRALYIHTW